MFNEDEVLFDDTLTTIDSITITLPKTGDLLSAASLTVGGPGGAVTFPSVIRCFLTLDGVVTSNIWQLGLGNFGEVGALPVSPTGFATAVAAGVHTVALKCERPTGPPGGFAAARFWALHAWEGA